MFDWQTLRVIGVIIEPRTACFFDSISNSKHIQRVFWIHFALYFQQLLFTTVTKSLLVDTISDLHSWKLLEKFNFLLFPTIWTVLSFHNLNTKVLIYANILFVCHILGTPVQLFVSIKSNRLNQMAAIHACSLLLSLLKFKLTTRMRKKWDFSDKKKTHYQQPIWLLVPNGLLWVFQKLLKQSCLVCREKSEKAKLSRDLQWIVKVKCILDVRDYKGKRWGPILATCF